MNKPLIFSSITAIALISAAPAQAQQAASNAPPAPETVETVDADPALWVVQDEDTTIYLFGTVHILKPGLSWFDEAVKQAFDESDELILEIVEPDPQVMQTIIMSKAMNPDNPLRDKLNDEQKASYDTAMASLGLPVTAFDQFDPWFAAVNLGVLPLFKAGYDVNSGAEKVLSAAAKESGKTIDQLETPAQQMSFFDELPEENQINFLIFTADAVDEVPEQIDSMVTSWSQADTNSLAEMMNAGFTDKVLYDTLLTNRNVNWADWIKNRLDEPGTVFVAVGAGHLAGDESVQVQLKELNIESTRIEY